MRQKEEQRWIETLQAAVAAEDVTAMPGTHGGGATRRKSSPGSMKRGKETYEIGRLELEHELLLLEILNGGAMAHQQSATCMATGKMRWRERLLGRRGFARGAGVGQELVSSSGGFSKLTYLERHLHGGQSGAGNGWFSGNGFRGGS